MTGAFPLTFAPGRVGSVALRNRLVLSPMSENMADRNGLVTPQQIAWYRRKAAGGVGWVNVGCAYVTPAGRPASEVQLAIDRDACVSGLRDLVTAIHAEGAHAGIQLCHAGRQTTSRYLADGLRPEAPSPVAEPLLGETPVELSDERIGDIVQEFADATVRARDAGFDFVEIHGANGYLQHVFLSALANQRDGRYGGCLEARARFSIECIAAMRAAVGDDMAIGFRLPCDDFTPGGMTITDALVVLGWLEGAGLDFVCAAAGRGGSYESARLILAPPGIGPGHLEHYAAAIRAQARVPVVSTGRYTTAAMAEAVLERGSADFVAMGRALIADPDLPRKAVAGRSADVRPCVACEQGCIDRWLASLDATCTVNPEAGRELEPGWGAIATVAAPTARRVLVVGGGPAGMEAARCAALAGHDVTLWERGPLLGGQLRLAARAPYGGEWDEYCDWQARQVAAAGVRVELGREASRKAILAHGFQEVILATGARPWLPREIPGWDEPHVTTPFDVLAGEIAPGRRVVVLGGETIAARTALFLAAEGHQVTLVAGGHAGHDDPDTADLARDILGSVVRPMVIEWLTEHVALVLRRHVKRIEPGGIVHGPAGLFDPHRYSTRVGSQDDVFLAADTVVVGAARLPDDALFTALHRAPALAQVHVVGDATSPRTVTEAVAEGAACARLALGRVALAA